MKFVFWGSLLFIVYVYVGYPIILHFLSRIFPKPIKKDVIEPTVSIVITAYNEEKHLRDKLINTLNLDYPKEKMEVIVASDASTDRTDEIVKEFQNYSVTLLRQENRRGKTAAQNRAVSKAKGEIVFFSDATTHYEKTVLKKIVENFADPEVGCVGGLLKYVKSDNNNLLSGGGLYWSYETWIKQRESLLGTLIGVSGCLYAVRKEIYQPLPEDLISDFLIVLEVARKGYRTVLEPEAISEEKIVDRTGSEFQMRVRVAVRSLIALRRSSWALNLVKSGKLAWQLWSHKVLRYSIPFFLISVLIASIFSDGFIYQAFLAAQVVFYGFAALASFPRKGFMRNRFFAIPFYFCLANIASLVAFIEIARGERYITWETVRN